ncbi:interleukin-8-like [Mugil cephalus]|uniref:interleukin-8-like n=1 Tax=Mugil cephalus TaxID=48193 RepID=UPI001FB69C7A|nr:interleukin-8-like [Mugil cephalus]
MNNAIQCVILLACAAVCWSAAIKDCQCLKTTSNISWKTIIDVKDYDPSAYCNNRQVIVTLTDKSLRCLNPEKFTPAVVREMKKRLFIKMSTTTTTSPKTTTSPAPTPQQ